MIMASKMRPIKITTFTTPTKSIFDETCQHGGETEKSLGHLSSCMEKVGVADQQEERPRKSPKSCHQKGPNQGHLLS